jgi:hypothetical protein
MEFFNFLKSKPSPKADYISGIGDFIYSSDFGENAYRGKINFTNLEYKTEVVFPSDTKDISVYQLSYFKEIDNNIKAILEYASKMPDSKIELSKCNVVRVLIPDKENNKYDISSEIVVAQKEKKNIYGKSIYSLIMHELKIVEIITI